MEKLICVKLSREESSDWNPKFYALMPEENVEKFNEMRKEVKKASDALNWDDLSKFTQLEAIEDNLIIDAIRQCGGHLLTVDRTFIV